MRDLRCDWQAGAHPKLLPESEDRAREVPAGGLIALLQHALRLESRRLDEPSDARPLVSPNHCSKPCCTLRATRLLSDTCFVLAPRAL